MIDLSLLPPPDVVETLEFETLYQQILGNFRAHMGDQWTAVLESDPVLKLVEVAAFQKMLGRARVNSAAKASLLAYARGADLDNRAADFDVKRLELVPADPDAVPPVAAVMEKDDDFLYRIRLSLERLSVAGGRGAYEYHALTASADVASVSVDSPSFKAAEVSAQVRDLLPAGAIVLVCDYAAGLSNPLPGDVSLSVLPIVGSAADPTALVAAVQKSVSNEDVRPITDRPRSLLGQPDEYRVIAKLEVLDGPSLPIVVAAAKAKLAAVIAAARDLEGELSLSAIYGALHASGVRRVLLESPTADVMSDKRHYPSCIGIDVKGVVVS